jgi:hypothetical protein
MRIQIQKINKELKGRKNILVVKRQIIRLEKYLKGIVSRKFAMLLLVPLES